VGQGRRQAIILGVRVDDVTLPEAVDRVVDWSAGAAPRLVVTPNPEFVMAARRDPAFRAILNSAALAVPDGVGLLWAARLLGEPLRTTVPGVALVEALAPRAAALGQRWFLLGARAGVAAEAGRRLAARHPGLTIAGTLAGEPGPAGDAAALAALRAAAPVNLLLVAYGAPRQEAWLARNLAASGVPVGIGVGGTFDFLAGVSRRPPGWVQRAGFGWLFRLVNEPWRWRRQLALPQFAGLVLAAALRRRVHRQPT
jgi:N-acetylglucosaminyldiphosphoundecaprenol N-acetyl-beta-D-mannosaminyltransferase